MNLPNKDKPSICHALECSGLFYVIKTDLKGNYTYANDLFLHKFAHISSEFIGQPFAHGVYEEDAEKCVQAAIACLNNPQKPVEVQIRKPKKGGGLFWTTWEFSTLTNNQEEPEEILCIGIDNSENHSLNKQLILNAKRTESILQSITDGFLTLDKDWNFTKTNSIFDRLGGWDRNELAGKNFWEYYPEYKILLSNNQKAQQAFAEGKTFQFERFSERTQRWFSIKIYPSSEGLTVFFQDVTERKAQINEILEKNKLLTEIARIQSHQIRRPVATVLGLIQLIDKGELSEENKDLLEMLKKTALELDEVIHTIVGKASQTNSKKD